MNIVTQSQIDKNKETVSAGVYLTAHNCTPLLEKIAIPAQVTFKQGGSLARVSRIKPLQKLPRKGGGIRGYITHFTRQSRRRLQQTVASTNRKIRPLFVTLTYPRVFPDEPQVVKDHLRKFAQRLQRKFPNVGLVWRLEFQKRGAPHYHLLVWGATYRQLREFVPVSWYETVGSGDLNHLKAGTQVAFPESFKHLQKYISKEMSKVDQAIGYEGVGRWWGIKFRSNIPFCVDFTIELSERQAVQLMRLFRRHANIKARSYRSLSVFMDCGYWLSKLDKLIECLE